MLHVSLRKRAKYLSRSALEEHGVQITGEYNERDDVSLYQVRVN